ncbi:hypothetical protein EV138_5632 [Kribbella voronezhensis]|uniref:Uncharacterized protein n=1 Tax=Kribbella voronezhensis TaxID=2512212 RepID=A0A4R7SVH0_9ACTN|nr:hypothetical protein EV138_5632 [Kribbella voronezhensis]
MFGGGDFGTLVALRAKQGEVWALEAVRDGGGVAIASV